MARHTGAKSSHKAASIMMHPSASVRTILALVAVLLPLRLAAQNDESIPTPAEIPELAAPGAELWAASARPPRAVSDWDLYAGSVYANTSPIWVQAEYLLWWLRGNELPPLVTTSPAATPRADAGVLGEPNTQVLFGGGRVDDEARSGFHTSLGVRLGHWFDALMDSELQFDYMWLGDGQSSGDFQANSSDYAILARPFLNAESGQQDAQLISYPGVVVGAVQMETSSDLLGAGVLFRHGWLCGSRGRLEWLAGYRYLQLQERLAAYEALVVTDPGGSVTVGTTFDILEEMSTWNEFHGGDLGVQWWTEAHGWTLEVATKIALGGIARTVQIGGDTLVNSPGDSPVLVPGGLLALPTNIGRHHSSRFSAVPELSVTFRRPLTPHFILTVGYSLIVADHVVRTGDQLDLAVNPTQLGGGTLAGAARPAVLMNDSTLWLHGFNVGLEW
jgi:hypothetical protein